MYILFNIFIYLFIKYYYIVINKFIYYYILLYNSFIITILIYTNHIYYYIFVLHLKFRKYCNFGTKNSRRAWQMFRITLPEGPNFFLSTSCQDTS